MPSIFFVAKRTAGNRNGRQEEKEAQCTKVKQRCACGVPPDTPRKRELNSANRGNFTVKAVRKKLGTYGATLASVGPR